jgi:hypothetical protein
MESLTFCDAAERLLEWRGDGTVWVKWPNGRFVEVIEKPTRNEPKGNCPLCGALHYLGHAHICNTERSL